MGFSTSPVASTSRLPVSDETQTSSSSAAPHHQQPHTSSPPRNMVNLRRSSTIGDLADPKVHVDLAKPERALTAERLAQWNAAVKPHKRSLATLASPSSYFEDKDGEPQQQEPLSNFVDLFVGKGPAAKHHQHPEPQSQDASPLSANFKETSVLDGPSNWISNLMGSRKNIDASAAGDDTKEADEQSPQPMLDEADQIARDWHVLKEAYQTPKFPLGASAFYACP